MGVEELSEESISKTWNFEFELIERLALASWRSMAFTVSRSRPGSESIRRLSDDVNDDLGA